jgi:hypothetical protein
VVSEVCQQPVVAAFGLVHSETGPIAA